MNHLCGSLTCRCLSILPDTVYCMHGSDLTHCNVSPPSSTPITPIHVSLPPPAHCPHPSLHPHLPPPCCLSFLTLYTSSKSPSPSCPPPILCNPPPSHPLFIVDVLCVLTPPNHQHFLRHHCSLHHPAGRGKTTD